MTKKQILGTVMIYAGYALGCWCSYHWGKCNGETEAYYECTKQLMENDEDLRKKYPSVFGG